MRRFISVILFLLSFYSLNAQDYYIKIRAISYVGYSFGCPVPNNLGGNLYNVSSCSSSGFTYYLEIDGTRYEVSPSLNETTVRLSNTYKNVTLCGVYVTCATGSPPVISRSKVMNLNQFQPGSYYDLRYSYSHTGDNAFASFFRCISMKVEFKFVPEKPGVPTISTTTRSFCPGDVLDISAPVYYNGNFPGIPGVKYLFEALDEGGNVMESHNYYYHPTSFPTPLWHYTVPSCDKRTCTRSFRVTLIPDPSFPDYDVKNSPPSDNTPNITIYASPPTVSVTSTEAPTCNYTGDGKINLNIRGSASTSNGPERFSVGLSVYYNNAWQKVDFANPYINYSSNVDFSIDPSILSDLNIEPTDRILSGSYQFQVRNNYNSDGNQCSTANIQANVGSKSAVAVSGAPIALSGSAFHVSCSPGNDGSFNPGASGGNGGPYSFAYNGSPSTFTGTRNGLAEGTYNIVAYDSKSCSSAVSSAIVLQKPPAITLSAAPVMKYVDSYISCHGFRDGAMAFTIAGGAGIGAYSYGFSGSYASMQAAGRQFTFSGISKGMYTAHVTDGLLCTNTSPSTAIEDPPALAVKEIKRRKDYSSFSGINIFNGFDVSCQDRNGTFPYEGWLNVSGEGGITSAGYHFSIAATTLPGSYGSATVFTGLGVGLHQITLTDANNCITTASVNLDALPAPLSLSGMSKTFYNGHNISCNRQDYGEWEDGSVTVTMTGGVFSKPYSFQIAGTVATSSSAGNRAAFGRLGYGIQHFITSDDNNCTVQDTFFLDEPPKLKITAISHTEPLCNQQHNGTLNISVTGGITGVYTCQLVMPYHNRKNANDESGEYDSTKIFASGSFRRLPAGWYSFNFSDANHCQYALTVPGQNQVTDTAIFINDPNRIEAGSLNGYISCFGKSDSKVDPVVTGGNRPYAYTWTNESGSIVYTHDSVLADRPKGNYRLYLTDVHLCDNGKQSYLQDSGLWATTVLSGPHGEVFDAGVNAPGSVVSFTGMQVVPPSCAGNTNGSFTVNAGGGWGGFRIDTSKTTLLGSDSVSRQQFKNLPKGSYRVFARDWHGCLDSASVIVSEPEVLSLTGTYTPVACFDNKTGEVLLTATGGNGGYKYLLHSHGFLKNQDSGYFNTLGTGTYEGNVTDSKGCPANALLFVLTQPSLVTGSVINTQMATCGTASGIAVVTVAGGVKPYTYQWLHFPQSNFTTVAGALLSGTYKIKVMDAHQCAHTFSGFVDDITAPGAEIMIIRVPLCHQSGDGALALVPANGSPPYAFEWIDVNTRDSIASQLQGNRYYKGQVADNDGCKVSKEIFLPAPDPLSVDAKRMINPHCNNYRDGMISVTVTGGTVPYSYTWDDSLKQTSAVSIRLHAYHKLTGENSKVYKMVLKDRNGCQLNDSAMLSNPAPVKVKFPGDSAIVCEGQAVVLNAGNEGAAYSWSSLSGGYYSDKKIVSLNTSGIYTVTVTDPKGCTGSATFKIRTERNYLQSKFLMNTGLVVGDTSMLAEISWPVPDSLSWKLPESFKIVKQDESHIYVVADTTGEFEVRLTAKMALCIDTMIKKIKVEPSTKKGEGGRYGYRGINYVNAFPNPVTNELRIETSLTESMALKYELLASPYLIPVLVSESLPSLNPKVVMNSHELPPGFYILKVSSLFQFKVIKIIKQ